MNFRIYSSLLLLMAFLITSCGDDTTVDPATCATLGCPDGFTCVDDVCVEDLDGSTVRVTENVTTDATWTADKTYILAGRIAIEDGATLTIEAGTIVKGEAGNGASATALLVARGGKLNANGTAEKPIIFTSVADEITADDVAAGDYSSPNLLPTQNGLWGGVIVLGRAPISVEGDLEEVQIEGIPTSDANGLYGGTDAADNSGSISYVSIRHGGTNIGAGNEINGLTLGAVGSGTTIENIEIVANQDDGVEWFGGTVSVKNVVVWNAGDDAIDTDQAWAGTLDNFVVVTPGDASFELDGPEGSLTATHTIMNGSVIASSEDRISNETIDLDDDSMTNLKNIFITSINEGQQIFSGNAAGVSFENVALDISSGTLEDYMDGGVVPVGVSAGGSPQADKSVFGWTWASEAGGLDGI